MFTPKTVEGQRYSNRVRLNLFRIGKQRGLQPSSGLPHLTASGLWKFQTGRSDMTISKLAEIADDLGVSIFDLLANPDVYAEEG